jgi:hypothetical protein
MPKEIRKTIRFSKSEYDLIELEFNKSNVSFSEFARNSILRKKISSKHDNESIYQLSKIGNNLNQIARAVNKKEKILVLTQLVEIEKHLKVLVYGS